METTSWKAIPQLSSQCSARHKWHRNNDFIQQHNLEYYEYGMHGFVLGHNKYSDLDENEFAFARL